LVEVYYKEKLEKDKMLVFEFKHRHNSGAYLNVKACLDKKSGEKKQIGFAYVIIHGNTDSNIGYLRLPNKFST
jgi:hypothetical protein